MSSRWSSQSIWSLAFAESLHPHLVTNLRAPRTCSCSFRPRRSRPSLWIRGPHRRLGHESTVLHLQHIRDQLADVRRVELGRIVRTLPFWLGGAKVGEYF